MRLFMSCSWMAMVVGAWCTALAFAESPSRLPPPLKDVGIQERLGERVSIEELTFRDESGAEVKLSRYFGTRRPVLLALVYYECPSLCGFVMNGILSTLKKLSWTPGKEFETVIVSINPREGSELAQKKKKTYLEAYQRSGAELGWHFLTGQEEQIRKLAAQVGFGYRYVEEEKQYAHAAALFILTPEGKISRYLYGVQYQEKDLRFALLEASNGRIGTIVDRFLLFCFRYNPQTRQYSIYLTNVMKLAAALTVFIFGGYLFAFWNRQRRGSLKGN